MKYFILMLIGFLIYHKAASQDYISADRQGILGNVYYDQEKFDSAEIYWRKALQLIPDKTRFGPYFGLINIAYKHKDNKKIAEYLYELSCIYPKDTVYHYMKEYAEVDMDITTFNKLYNRKCHLAENKKYGDAHAKTVDSIIAYMRDRDQDVRNRINKKRGHMTEEEITAFEKEMKFIDSTNFLLLYDCLQKYGFSDIDYPYSWSRVTILDHIDNYDNFKKIDKYLLAAVKSGKYSPTSYAYSMDRSLVASKMKPKYYWFITGTPMADQNKPAEKDLKKVNKDRNAIGLPPYPLWTGGAF